jgi:SsrA-binding protein
MFTFIFINDMISVYSVWYRGDNKLEKTSSIKNIAENRKARHDYHIHETYETGIVLTGTEVKSLRAGKANLKDSYARIDEHAELMLYNMHISPYDPGNRFNHEPLRVRKLLMHRLEIDKLIGKTREKGYTLVPLKLYFSRGKAKVQLGLATGKKTYDKRQDIAERDAKRDMDRVFRERQKE